jgi:Mrp family chromosome partitioning ATPase
VQSKSFFTTQLVNSKKELKELNEKIKQFQARTGMVSASEQASDLVRRRASAGDALQDAIARLKQDTERIDYLQNRLGISSEMAAETAEAAIDPESVELRKKYAKLQAQYNELSTRFKPEHPKMRELSEAIEKIKKNAADTGFPLNSTKAGSRSKEALAQELAAVKTDQLGQKARIQMLKPIIADLDVELKTMPDKQLELSDLLRTQKVLIERVANFESSLGSAQMLQAASEHNDGFQVIDKPEIMGVSVTSKKPKVLAILLLAIFLGSATFFVLDRLDSRVRSVSTVLKILPYPLLGWLPEGPPTSNDPLEHIHRLRLSLKNWFMDGGRQIIVTSSAPFEGKSMLSAGLALSCAQVGTNVLLIDANSKQPRLHGAFGHLPLAPGLNDFLADPTRVTWSKVLNRANKNLQLITAGSRIPNGSLLSSENVPTLLQNATSEADLVIYNASATTESSSALALLSPDALMIVVVRMKHTHVPDLRLLATQLKQHRGINVGIVLANADDYAVSSALSKSEKSDDLDLVSA